MTTIEPSEAKPKRHLSVAYIIVLSVGMVVGAGIFKSPALVAQSADSAQTLYGLWLLGGLISLIGALCYGELATAYPSPGGDYHFLSMAFGKQIGFLFAWARLTIINTGSVALLGFVIGDYFSRVWSLGPHGPALYALVSVAITTAFNLRSSKVGVAGNYLLTSIEVFGLLLLAGAAGWLVLAGIPPATAPSPVEVSWSGLGYGMVFVLLAFGGWSEMGTLSAEVNDEKNGMVKALVGSVVIITLLYLLANWALLRGLGLQGLATSQAPAADLMARAFGENAGVLLAIAVAAATITSINGTIIVGARTTYAGARDVAAFKPLGVWDQQRGIPRNAILLQSSIAMVLVVMGAMYDGFATLVDYTAPVYWLFLMGSGVAVIVLRQKYPAVSRPFKVPLYPILPIVFTLSSFAMLVASLNYVKAGAIFGLVVLGLGLLVLVAVKPKAKA